MRAVERITVRHARSDLALGKLAASHLRVDPERRCSRCDLTVEDEDLSPGRYWCRPCERERRNSYNQAKRDAA